MTYLACTLPTISPEPLSSAGQASPVLSSPTVIIVLALVCITMFLCALAGRGATEMTAFKDTQLREPTRTSTAVAETRS